jgi:hypothetical protein
MCNLANLLYKNLINQLVNGEYITVCSHDDAVNILRNAGDIVVLTVKHYRAATPFLQKQRKCLLIKLDNEYKLSFPTNCLSHLPALFSLFTQLLLSGDDRKLFVACQIVRCGEKRENI